MKESNVNWIYFVQENIWSKDDGGGGGAEVGQTNLHNKELRDKLPSWRY